MKISNNINGPCVIMIGFTSYHLCFLKRCRVNAYKLIPLVIVKMMSDTDQRKEFCAKRKQKKECAPSVAQYSQINNIGTVEKSNLTFNNSILPESSTNKRKAEDELEHISKKINSDKEEEQEKEETSREESPVDVWKYFKRMLDLGRDNVKYHRYSAIRNGIIICGDGILAQKEIDDSRYKELKIHCGKESTPITHSNSSKEYLSGILTADNMKSFERKVRSIPAESGDEVFYLQDICFVVLNLIKNSPDIRDEEKNYIDYCVSPLMRAAMSLTGEGYSYESREAFLKSINTIWKNNGTIKSTAEGYKADGIVRRKELEIMLVEACGVFGNTAMSKIQFDRHKGLYACLAMLRTIAVKYKYATLTTFESLKILFLHTKGSYLQLWTVSYTDGIFVFNKLAKYELSLEFEFKAQTISNCIQFAHVVKAHLESTGRVLDTLSYEHSEAIASSILGETTINDTNNLSHIINPRMHKMKETKGESGFCYGDPVSEKTEMFYNCLFK